jgi:hypothetical protein
MLNIAIRNVATFLACAFIIWHPTTLWWKLSLHQETLRAAAGVSFVVVVAGWLLFGSLEYLRKCAPVQQEMPRRLRLIIGSFAASALIAGMATAITTTYTVAGLLEVLAAGLLLSLCMRKERVEET